MIGRKFRNILIITNIAIAMKKKITAFLMSALTVCVVSAQVVSRNAVAPSEESLFERVTQIEKKNDLLNVYLNMNGAFNTSFNQNGVDGLDEGAFKMSQLRIEAKGQVNSWLSYRWRQRLNRSNYGNEDIDNLPTSIDFAAIGIKLGKKFSIFAGKQCVAYGGIEYDLNPIEIYQYSEMINNMSNFMTGITFIYDFTPDQQLQFQILNSRNASQEETYGVGLEKNRLPLVYTLNWNANLFNKVWQTRWSVSLMDETKDKYMYYLALGNQFNFSKKFDMYFDIMSSFEEVDRKGIMTNMLGGRDAFGGHNAVGTMYNSLVTKMNYRFKPRWNAFVKGMLESAAMYKTESGVDKGNYRTSLGYLAGVEFYPIEKSNLHFYCTFIGQSNFFTSRAKSLGLENYSTQRVALGFIYQLPVF